MRINQITVTTDHSPLQEMSSEQTTSNKQGTSIIQEESTWLSDTRSCYKQSLQLQQPVNN